MGRKKGCSRWPCAAWLALFLAGCSGAGAGGEPRAWIDAPLHNSTHPVAPMEIVLHGADPGGVAMIELSVNGEVLSRRPPDDTSAALTTIKIQWDPRAAGEYLLVARAQNHAGAWSAQASSRITLAAPETIAESEPPRRETPPTRTPSPVLRPSPTSIPPCVDRAAFVADLTTPDNTRLAPGASFTKVWRLRNDGSCPWNQDYQVVFVDGAAMSNTTPLPIPNVVQPGGTVDIRLDLVAPTTAGTHRGDYQIRNPHGVHFGVGPSGQTSFYVQIVVGSAAGTTPTAPPPPDNLPPAVSVSHIPPGGSLPTGSVITFTASASDNVGVTRIDLWVIAPGGWPTNVKTCHNTSSCSYTGGPYTTQGNLSYWAVAADAAGHETSSSSGTIVIYVVIS